VTVRRVERNVACLILPSLTLCVVERVSRIYLRPLWKIQVRPIAASIRAETIAVGGLGLRAR
jgi:hypothetical protein